MYLHEEYPHPLLNPPLPTSAMARWRHAAAALFAALAAAMALSSLLRGRNDGGSANVGIVSNDAVQLPSWLQSSWSTSSPSGSVLFEGPAVLLQSLTGRHPLGDDACTCSGCYLTPDDRSLQHTDEPWRWQGNNKSVARHTASRTARVKRTAMQRDDCLECLPYLACPLTRTRLKRTPTTWSATAPYAGRA